MKKKKKSIHDMLQLVKYKVVQKKKKWYRRFILINYVVQQ